MEGLIVLPSGPSLANDEAMKNIWPDLKRAAFELTFAKKSARSVLLRFHGDADGIAGAFAISAVLRVKSFQQNSAIYSVRDALRDISLIGQENAPMVILLDFGSSDDCTEALDLLAAGGIDYLVVDHHPYTQKDNGRIINPFKFGENASKYTAGVLSCEIAIACGLEQEKALSLAKIACSGDKSDVVHNDDEDAKKAMVLDFLASHISFGNNLEFYKNVMEKDELFRSILEQATESIESAAEKAIGRSKHIAIKELNVYYFPLEGIVKRGEWPPSSKVTTRVYDKLGPKGALICIGYTERSIIIRINDGGIALGYSANELARMMRESMEDFVEGGGGHAKAGAIRVKEGFAKDVLNELIRKVTSNG